MYKINDQTVLEEDYDENYQPTEEGPYLNLVQFSTSVDVYKHIQSGPKK